MRKSLIVTSSYTGYHPRLGASQTIPVNLVIKHGFTDFTQDPEYDSGKHQIIEKNFDFDPDIYEQDWFWNSSTQTFQQTAP